MVDAAAGHIYWTNMGNPVVNDGSIERANKLRAQQAQVLAAEAHA